MVSREASCFMHGRRLGNKHWRRKKRGDQKVGINASPCTIPFFPNRIQWNDYEKEANYIHDESSQQ
tara:strand:+ start:409 stop:606 length:198 start_codon:yes stop_codon:yes gene_type:complete